MVMLYQTSVVRKHGYRIKISEYLNNAQQYKLHQIASNVHKYKHIRIHLLSSTTLSRI